MTWQTNADSVVCFQKSLHLFGGDVYLVESVTASADTMLMAAGQGPQRRQGECWSNQGEEESTCQAVHEQAGWLQQTSACRADWRKGGPSCLVKIHEAISAEVMEIASCMCSMASVACHVMSERLAAQVWDQHHLHLTEQRHTTALIDQVWSTNMTLPCA